MQATNPIRFFSNGGLVVKDNYIMALKTKKAIKRENRNANITALYLLEIKKEGSMKSAVVEQLAKDLKVSITTVNRIVKPIII